MQDRHRARRDPFVRGTGRAREGSEAGERLVRSTHWQLTNVSKYLLARIEDYEALIGGDAVERIREKARKLKGLRVANFNSTFHGGGVAETLSSITLLMNSLGLRTEWRVIQGTPIFSRSRKRCIMLCRLRRSTFPA